MSRVDEAIRRRDQQEGAAPADLAKQEAFASAWTLAPSATPEEGPKERGHFEVAVRSEAAGAGPGNATVSVAWRERLTAGGDKDPILLEQFRRLAATLHRAHLSQGLRSVMVTSPDVAEGKTTTAINLALVLAESYRYRVLLIDADLRRPSISRLLDVGEGVGLSEALRAQEPMKLSLAKLSSGLTLLPAGGPTLNSIEALVSPRMREILDQAVEEFDWVVMDAPPVGPATDARLLSQLAGGTLLVVRAGQSQYPDVARAIDAIGRENILGVVLNGVESPKRDGYYYAPDVAAPKESGKRLLAR